MNSDPAGPIENAMAKADASYKCNAYLCRGYQYEDNVGRVQHYSAGQIVPFFVDLVAAHKPGWAVSQARHLREKMILTNCRTCLLLI